MCARRLPQHSRSYDLLPRLVGHAPVLVTMETAV